MFVIKHNGMYFTGFNYYLSMEGYLDKKHPKKTLKFGKNQHKALEFISYEKAFEFKHKNNVLGTVTLIQAEPKLYEPIKPDASLMFAEVNDYNIQLLMARDEIEKMIGTSSNNFYHMQKDILKVNVSTLNKFFKQSIQIISKH